MHLEVTTLMKTRLFNSVLSLFVLLSAVTVSSARGQSEAQNPENQKSAAKPVVFTTAPKLVIAKLKNGEQDIYDVRGKVTFTVTSANSDDTVGGIIKYVIPDDARQKIATVSGKQMSEVPTSITRKDIFATFEEGTGAPVIHLEISPMDVDVAGLKLKFNRIVVDVNGRDGGPIEPYTKEEMEALFTVWAKQINNQRQRRGPIQRMNKVINGEPAENQN
jgi:hypothetical protein